ncbi:hypothetical protein ColTof4_00190 [Colletotrichum tofieldiae]|nr:hypothetical protein ColTof3_07388 [Colletotrichum tofieldiae]GKT67767.1 hypothetical protein ColTof4_00190 [Colletotrichum tofieldiae]
MSQTLRRANLQQLARLRPAAAHEPLPRRFRRDPGRPPEAVGYPLPLCSCVTPRRAALSAPLASCGSS